MPELPEVETVRRDLEASLLGDRITAVTVTHPRTVRRQHPDELVNALVGQRLVRVDRRGKFLLLGLGDERVLVVHLRMSGQLILSPTGALRAVHTHVVIGFERAGELHFVDPRTFGELFIAQALDDGLPVELAGLGPDPLIEEITPARLAAIVKDRRAAVKTVLLNQHLIAGIGNIYGDEICFVAGVRPDRPAGALSDARVTRLAGAITAVLAEATALRGSTLADARYRDLAGEPGSYQGHHRVYARAGEPCAVCQTVIRRVVVGGRSAHFCSRCQR